MHPTPVTRLALIALACTACLLTADAAPTEVRQEPRPIQGAAEAARKATDPQGPLKVTQETFERATKSVTLYSDDPPTVNTFRYNAEATAVAAAMLAAQDKVLVTWEVTSGFTNDYLRVDVSLASQTTALNPLKGPRLDDLDLMVNTGTYPENGQVVVALTGTIDGNAARPTVTLSNANARILARIIAIAEIGRTTEAEYATRVSLKIDTSSVRLTYLLTPP